MDTWVSYAENLEAMEKQLDNKIKIESLRLFNMQLNGMLLQFVGTDEFNLMQSINIKRMDYTVWYNHLVVKRYARRKA